MLAETDVVRVFDPNLQLSEEAVMKILKEMDLNWQDHTSSVQTSVVTRSMEYGKNRKETEKTIRFMVQNPCSKAGFWKGVFEQNLPDHLLSSKIGSTFVRDIQSRVNGRKTKYCKIGLEFITTSVGPKRGYNWCFFYWFAQIVY